MFQDVLFPSVLTLIGLPSVRLPEAVLKLPHELTRFHSFFESRSSVVADALQPSGTRLVTLDALVVLHRPIVPVRRRQHVADATYCHRQDKPARPSIPWQVQQPVVPVHFYELLHTHALPPLFDPGRLYRGRSTVVALLPTCHTLRTSSPTVAG